MRVYIIRRILQAIPLLFIISIISFLMMTLSPGDPVQMYKSQSGEASKNIDENKIREMMGIDKPIYVQYLKWMDQLVLHGNLGYSFEDGRPVVTKILERIPATLTLMGVSMLISFSLSIPIGIYSAVKQYSKFDYTFTTFSFIGYSVPSFFIALMMIYFFSLKLGWFPVSDMRSVYDRFDFWDRVHHIILPALTMAVGNIAFKSRFMRTSMVEVVRQEYIRTARAKGLSEKKVILKHALRNGLLPIITILGMQLPSLLGGSLFIENIFAWPGLGRLGVNAIYVRDFQVIMGTTMFAAIMVVLGNLIADILYAVVDPRIQYGKSSEV